jgi:RsiW-degrading membrane proteinase PrsW (M82 family)
MLLLGSAQARKRLRREEPAVTRTNTLYLVIGALAVAVFVLAYQLYQDRHEPQGVHIDVGPGGLSIQGK